MKRHVKSASIQKECCQITQAILKSGIDKNLQIKICTVCMPLFFNKQTIFTPPRVTQHSRSKEGFENLTFEEDLGYWIFSVAA